MEPAKLDFEPSTGVRNRTACSHGISANLISERRASASSVRNPWLDQVGKVLETLNQGVVISDEDKRIVFANSMFLEMGNMSAESIIGRSVMDLYPPANLAAAGIHRAPRSAGTGSIRILHSPSRRRTPARSGYIAPRGGDDGRAYGISQPGRATDGAAETARLRPTHRYYGSEIQSH